MERADLVNRFAYHPPESPEAVEAHEHIRELHLEVATFLNGTLPDSRELSLAVTALEESMMWANAALARHRPNLSSEGGWVRK